MASKHRDNTRSRAVPAEEFIGERIEVEQSPVSPRPVRFTWRGRVHEVCDVLNERVDTGFGRLPPSSRKWFTKRHRRGYVVNAEGRRPLCAAGRRGRRRPALRTLWKDGKTH